MILLFLFYPECSYAAVIINEVAWMGTSVSANDEWIELYNDGSQSVDVEGWVLTDGMNLNITLSGSIAAEQYAVLERTDDDSVQGAAFLVYVGSLVNVGVTLSLYDAGNALEDRVVGNENWESIGGDNVTKETAQYTTSGWVTAAGTPGNKNSAVTVHEEKEEISKISEEATTEDNTSSVTTLYKTPRTLHLHMTVPSRVYVNQEVSMEVDPTGLSTGILQSLTHKWNFGDFTVDEGKEVIHRFEYPGEYVVTLHSQYKDYEAYGRKTVTVLPVSFSMTTNASGDIQVHNDAKYEVDLSGYTIVAGKTLAFPEGTILLPNATITIPKKKLKYIQSATAVLFDDTAVLVASISPTMTPQLQSPAIAQAVPSPTQAPMIVPVAHSPIIPSVPSETKTPPENFSFADEEREGSEKSEVTQQSTSLEKGVNQMAAPIEAAEGLPEGKLPYYALLAVIGLGVTAVFAGKVK